jgi:hypothetical protein
MSQTRRLAAILAVDVSLAARVVVD